MPTWVPGSSRGRPVPARAVPRARRGFTLLELLVVIAIVALSAGVVSLALRDGDAAQLEEEGARLTALLEMARADSRVAGVAVRFVPAADAQAPEGPQFRFVGLPAQRTMPTRWLDPRVSAQIVGGTTLVLGPDAILPPQRIVLRLQDQRLELASDGLGPFAVATADATP
ncbi:MAG: prepilin-type N-terminal cleavage/methylation domain-containing protein [Rubrivivax sp.]|nr:prepilin-type N-terminal cleavage/methylation domain-containing protein [Rubrivivax sp.]